MALAVFLGGEAEGRIIMVPDPAPPIFMIPVTNRSSIDDKGPGSGLEINLTHTARRQTYLRLLTEGPDIGYVYRFEREEAYGS